MALLDWVGAGSTFLLFICLFLPWYSVLGFSEDGLYHGFMIITLLLCLVVFGYFAAKLGWGRLPINLPLPESGLLLGIFGLNLLLVIIAMLTAPGGTDLDAGAIIGLIAALAAIGSSLWPYVEKAQQNRPTV